MSKRFPDEIEVLVICRGGAVGYPFLHKIVHGLEGKRRGDQQINGALTALTLRCGNSVSYPFISMVMIPLIDPLSFWLADLRITR